MPPPQIPSVIQNDRRHQRVSCKLPLDVEYVGRSGVRARFKGTTMDLSISGLGIMLFNDFWGLVGVKSRMHVRFISKKETIKVSGWVARVITKPDGSITFGLEFDQPRFSMLTNLKDIKSVWVELNENLNVTRTLHQ